MTQKHYKEVLDLKRCIDSLESILELKRGIDPENMNTVIPGVPK